MAEFGEYGASALRAMAANKVRSGLSMLGILIGAFLATWLNPYGPGLYRWVFQLLGDEFFMRLHTEWHSPDFRGPGAMRFEMLILLLPVLLALSKRRPNLVEVGLCVFWLHAALTEREKQKPAA